MAIGLDVIAMLSFFALVGVILFLDRKNLEFIGRFIIIRRWKRGQYVMDRWIFSHRKFLETLGSVGVVLGFIAAVGGLVTMVFYTTVNQQAGAFLLPTAGDFQYPPGIWGVPFWFWLVSIFVVLTVHEPMHAIFARLAGIPVRSWGIMTLLVLPMGAFVDPDMKKLLKLKLWPKLKILAGGSLGNFLTGFVVLLIIILLANTLFGQATISGTPAGAAGVEGDLLSVNGVEIKTLNNLTRVLNETPPGTVVDVVTDKGTYQVTTASPPGGGQGSYLGLSFGLKPQYQELRGAVTTLMELLKWLFIFNVGVGIFNMFPIRPFDGGHFFEALFSKLFKSDKLGRTAINITSILVFGLVLFNVFGTNAIKALI